MPMGSVLKLGRRLAGDGPGACREASGRIAYKSPGHIYTERCLARVMATLSEDSLESQRYSNTRHACIYTRVQMHWLENGSMERAPVRARGISGCGHSACVAAEQDLRSLWKLLTKTGSECSFMSFGGGHPSSKPQSSSLILHAGKNELLFNIFLQTKKTTQHC